MKIATVIDSILAEIAELKDEAMYAKREAELNKELAQDYKRKYEVLLQKGKG